MSHRWCLLEDGMYMITQVHSPAEFYGYSQARALELQTLFDRLADHYDRVQNDSTLTLTLFVDGTVCVIHHDGKYHRVVVK